jgi:hypothetical protein
LVAAVVALSPVPSIAQSVESPAVSDVATAAACTVADFDQAAGKTPSIGFTRTECAQGWGLAAGPEYLDLFRQKAGRWAAVSTGSPDGLAAWAPSEFATVGIAPTLLRQLAQPFWLSVRQLIEAGALADALAGHEAALKAAGA